MKKTLIIISSLFLIVLLPACKKQLKEEPKTFISPGAFFTSPESYELTVKGIYSDIPATLSSNSWLTRESFSDINGTPDSKYEQGIPTYQNNHQPFFYNVREQGSAYYSIVKNANFILKELGVATVLSDAQKNALIGEARFLRAYQYWILMDLFANPPFVTEDDADKAEEGWVTVADAVAAQPLPSVTV